MYKIHCAYAPNHAPMYHVLQMHEVQNLALHIRNPATRILKLGIFCNKENLPQGNRIFP